MYKNVTSLYTSAESMMQSDLNSSSGKLFMVTGLLLPKLFEWCGVTAKVT